MELKITKCTSIRWLSFRVLSSVPGAAPFKIALLLRHDGQNVTKIWNFHRHSPRLFSCRTTQPNRLIYRHRRDGRTVLIEQVRDRQGGRWPFVSFYPTERSGQGGLPFLDLKWVPKRRRFFFFFSFRAWDSPRVSQRAMSWEGMREWRWNLEVTACDVTTDRRLSEN